MGAMSQNAFIPAAACACQTMIMERMSAARRKRGPRGQSFDTCPVTPKGTADEVGRARPCEWPFRQVVQQRTNGALWR